MYNRTAIPVARSTVFLVDKVVETAPLCYKIFQALAARPSDLKSAVNVNGTFKACSALQERHFISSTKANQFSVVLITVCSL
jgi:hypothetical protein